jgi:hypothetical protein
MPIQMNWGYRKRLKVDVVTLSNSYECDLPIPVGHSKLVVGQRYNPPLGLSLAATLRELENRYRGYTEEIVQRDLESYVLVAYID